MEEILKIIPMRRDHVDAVYAIELGSFSIPWTKGEFYRELGSEHAVYLAASLGGEIVGYAGMWHIVNEGHITNVAVREDCRGQGVGGALVAGLLREAAKLGMIGVTLEVRAGNARAQALYSKFGFRPEGIRKNYYSDVREDAIIMWKYLSEA
ncbi:MAG: ribosomal protein S18-alanine N-acetyltransferase [Clostridiales bacterium]|jgi:ribosomal-protein-alanine N-acetyltransferase|nr:ribosomal protein S18-alanine N-acetyltransferase [Clostridiales bacterium]